MTKSGDKHFTMIGFKMKQATELSEGQLIVLKIKRVWHEAKILRRIDRGQILTPKPGLRRIDTVRVRKLP